MRVRPYGLYCGAVEQFVLDAARGSIHRALGEDACIRVHKVQLVNVEANVALVADRRAPHVASGKVLWGGGWGGEKERLRTMGQRHISPAP